LLHVVPLDGGAAPCLHVVEKPIEQAQLVPFVTGFPIPLKERLRVGVLAAKGSVSFVHEFNVKLSFEPVN
jgi:hypothetical protein